MNEKYVEALEQYDMEVRAVRKGRGSWICETDQGCRLLKEYRGTARRLEFEDEVLGRLDTRGSLRADRYLRNREGGLMTVTGDGTRYILKDWFLDRECDLKDNREIRLAASRLARASSMDSRHCCFLNPASTIRLRPPSLPGIRNIFISLILFWLLYNSTS